MLDFSFRFCATTTKKAFDWLKKLRVKNGSNKLKGMLGTAVYRTVKFFPEKIFAHVISIRAI